MKTLKATLSKYLPPPVAELGPKKLRQEQLRADLLAVSEKNKTVFQIGVGMLVVLFVAALGLVWLWQDRPQLITGVFAATGVSITGIVASMFSYWKEKVRADIMIALLSGTDNEETIKEVIGVLAQRL